MKEVLLPGLQLSVDMYGEIYYLLVLDTSVKNFTAGAWFQDMIASIKHFIKWKKVAIVTDELLVEQFTDFFTHLSPAEAKGYKLSELEEAQNWVSIKI